MSAQTLGFPISLPLSAKEHQRRAGAYAKAEKEGNGKPSCSKRIWVGLFFDGTNNNMRRDEDFQTHSNIVRLYHAYPNLPDDGYFAFYIPGVGTDFSEIGEATETSRGKAYGAGGSGRIQWALMRVLNAVHYAINGSLMIPNDEANSAINDPMRLRSDRDVARQKQKPWFREKILTLLAHTADRQPTITHIDLSIFGFSRGAAEARAFCHWLLDYCLPGVSGGLSLAGVPLTINFLGLFDTVASVGLADSVPLPVHGLMDWADGTMRIPPQVVRCVHLVAAHEIRASFPLSSARDGKSLPANVFEGVYPGAHSNLGGGYAPGEQGRSRAGVSSLLSQIPLRYMHWEASNAGVPLQAVEKMPEAMRADFEVSPHLLADFSAFLKHTNASGARVEDLLEEHMRYYRRYKAVTADWETESMKAASAQDLQDMKEGNGDYRRAAEALHEKARIAKLNDRRIAVKLTERDEQLLADLQAPVPKEVIHFLDTYVHDSHAGFYLAGPVTEYDKKEEIRRVEERVKSGKTLSAWDKKVWTAWQQGKPFPLMTDADHWDMLHGASTVVIGTTNTRRESAGYFRQRVVFDKS